MNRRITVSFLNPFSFTWSPAHRRAFIFFQNSKLRIGDRLAFRQSVLGVLFTILAGERIIITSWEPLGVGRDQSVDSWPWSDVKKGVLQKTPQRKDLHRILPLNAVGIASVC